MYPELPMPKDKFYWFRPNGFGEKQKVEVIARYDQTRVRVQTTGSRFFYLAEIDRDLFKIF